MHHIVWRILILWVSFSFSSDVFAEKEMNFQLKKDCGNEKVSMKKVLGKGYGWLNINFIISILCLLDFSFSSVINLSSFSYGSLSRNNFIKVSKLCSIASLVLWLTFTFFVCYCILTTSGRCVCFRDQYFHCLCKMMGQRYSKGLQIPYCLPMGKEYATIFHRLFHLVTINPTHYLLT